MSDSDRVEEGRRRGRLSVTRWRRGGGEERQRVIEQQQQDGRGEKKGTTKSDNVGEG